jgi:hypothetical protein
VNARRILAIHHLRSDHTELAEVSARPGEDHPTVTPAEMDAACGAAMAAVDRLQRELDTMTLLRDEILVGVMFP